MMTSKELIRRAKLCHTKSKWIDFFKKYNNDLLSLTDSKPIEHIFKRLKQDAYSRLYSDEIWQILLQSCLNTWNLELGKQISNHLSKTPSANTARLSADIHMQSGSPRIARQIAYKALRLKKNSSRQILHLQMIICNSYVEEGNQAMALRLLLKLDKTMNISELPHDQLSDLLINMARAQFFLGNYLKAATIFYKAHLIYLRLNQWECASKGLFNSAASYHNSGLAYQKKAFELVARCKLLAEKRGLEGALSHCYAFIGTDKYQRGNFKNAIIQYQRSLEYLPQSDKSFRRLHITSMIAFSYIRVGRFDSAKRFGALTLDLAKHDKSERFRSRYINLKAEILWQEGQVDESQSILKEATSNLFQKGVHTLEELSTISRYYLQSAYLLEEASLKLKVSEQLKSNTISWLEFQHSKVQYYISKQKLCEAQKLAQESMAKAKQAKAHYYLNLAIIALLQIKIMRNELDKNFYNYLKEVESSNRGVMDTPTEIQLTLIQTSISYKKGQFSNVRKLLQNLRLKGMLGVPNETAISCWLTTINGHSPKLNSFWQIQFIASNTKIYFSPIVETIGEHFYKVSQNYTIDLKRHEILSKILHYLINQPGQSCDTSQLQSSVWNQSLTSKGWQQKIRNAIMRIRDHFPYTMAPIILHSDNRVSLFSNAIEFQTIPVSQSIDSYILTALSQGDEYSSSELARITGRSIATIKRSLAVLKKQQRVQPAKSGRNTIYRQTNNLDQLTLEDQVRKKL